MYVFTSEPIPLDERLQIADKSGAGKREMNQTFWDLTDEWFDLETGIEVDLIYWDPVWIEEQLACVLDRHEASLGYTTAFWHTIQHAQVLYDKNGWLTALKARAACPYPEELRDSIVLKNHPVLRRTITSYLHQIEKAVRRGDLVSMNHRTAALLASYFDVIFALNRMPHPGEKRLVEIVDQRCEKKPENLVSGVQELIQAGCSASPEVVKAVDRLIDGLDALLLAEGFDPQTSRPAR